MAVVETVHLSLPRSDTGYFTTSEVRPREKKALTTSRVIALPRNHYKRPPVLATGFSGLEISCKHPVRAGVIAESITTSDFKIGVETWGESRLFWASTVWIERKASAKDCAFGQFDVDAALCSPRRPVSPSIASSVTSDMSENHSPVRYWPPKKRSRAFAFPRAFQEPPEIVCWLNRLDLSSGEDYDYKIRTFADDITIDGFVAHLNAWENCDLQGAAMCWIAFPKGKKHVDSGRIYTGDVRRRSRPRPRTAATVRFKKRFERVPTVLAAINMLDAAGNADLRINLAITNVTRDGFRWSFETWGDSTLYAAGAQWIAMGFE